MKYKVGDQVYFLYRYNNKANIGRIIEINSIGNYHITGTYVTLYKGEVMGLA